MTEKPLLHFDEINSLRRVEELQQLYVNRNPKLKQQDLFIRQLKTDWKIEQKRLAKEAEEKEIPQQLPLHRVNLSGRTYNLFGVIHDYASGEQYRKLVQEAFDTSPGSKFLEVGISSSFPQVKTSAFNLDDIGVSDSLQLFKEGILSGLESPVFLLEMMNRYMRLKKTANSDLKNLNLSPFTYGSLPSYVDIELRRLNRKKLTDLQTRSAYEAAFLTAWGDSQVNFLVGKNHIPKIDYFLTRGIGDERIIERANRKVNLLKTDPERYQKELLFNILKDSSIMFAGIEVGWTPYLIMGWTVLGAAYKLLP